MNAPAIKFCGLTRPEDAAHAAKLGARYVGAVFAGGPRAVSAERARDVLGAAGAEVLRVGVFGSARDATIPATARTARLDVIQLHGDPEVGDVVAVRDATHCDVWGVLRLAGGVIPPRAGALFASADATVVDSKVEGQLGGTGVALEWEALAAPLRSLRRDRVFVLAGGLNAGNVRRAIDALDPDVVDVSSGVEVAPGVKDHGLMETFAAAVRA